MDRYEQITDRIVEALARGVVPWVKPWDAGSEVPRNGQSGHEYRGLNLLACWSNPFCDPRYYTFNQIKGYGKSHVKRGEKGTPIIKWLFIEKAEEQGNDREAEVSIGRIPVLKCYSVFNHEQVNWDIDRRPREPVALATVDPAAMYAEAGKALERSGLVLRHGGGRAYYSPLLDTVTVPRPEAFATVEAYWSTVFHEMTHWTGHPSRLNRAVRNRFGDNAYAFEELVAELGAAFLCAGMGIQGALQHPEYIGNWLAVMKGDKYAVFTAARHAREAVAYIRRNDQAEGAEAEGADGADGAEDKSVAA